VYGILTCIELGICKELHELRAILGPNMVACADQSAFRRVYGFTSLIYPVNAWRSLEMLWGRDRYKGFLCWQYLAFEVIDPRRIERSRMELLESQLSALSSRESTNHPRQVKLQKDEITRTQFEWERPSLSANYICEFGPLSSWRYLKEKKLGAVESHLFSLI
jgi:hypothetical protein